MSTAQLQELMAQVEQLTLVNNKLQQELCNNSSQLARLETAMQRRRGGRTGQDDDGRVWSQCSSSRSSRSEDVPVVIMDPQAKPLDLSTSTATGSHGANRKDSSSSTTMVTSSHQSGADGGAPTTPQRPRWPQATDGAWQEPRERRDSGSCDHTEPEMNGLVYRDVSTNTPSAQQVHFAQLPGADDSTGPGVVSSDRHGNELITIGTQTTEVVMTTDCEHERVVENVRGCSKAATPQQLSDFYHGAWPISIDADSGHSMGGTLQETQSVMSFHSSISSHSSRPSHHYKDSSHRLASQVAQNISDNQSVPIALQPLAGSQPLGPKAHMVCSLLSMLGTHDPEDMSQTLLAMSSSSDSCVAMRQSGCLPLLVQLIYGSESDKEPMAAGRVCRARACKALHNIIHSSPDDKRNRREVKILKYLQVVQAHCEVIRQDEAEDEAVTALAESIWPPADLDKTPGPAVAALMKLSFDDHSRQPICALGGLQCMGQLIKFDQSSYSASSDVQRITMRRYACMTLTNLTFGDSTNKAKLCTMQSCLDGIVLQLQSFNEDLCQVAASVIRNLSWKADQASKRHLRLSRAATKLMITAIQVGRESTLKSILSALWNLSAHCTYNKTCICEVDGSIEFLVNMLSYQSPSKTLAIVECAGGILRNISSVIAMRDDYRQILRNHNALEILLTHLKSPSLAIVGNACGALWNISARCPEDQRVLIHLSAISMLKNLTTSKHRLISLGSAATIKNLMAFKADGAKGARATRQTGKRREGAEANQPDSPSRLKGQDNSNHSSTELTSKVQRANSQDSVGSCSSLTNREGLTTLNKIEHMMQEVLQANMEIHQMKRVPSSTHSSDTRIHSGSSTPRSKAAMASNFTVMSKSSEYPMQASTNPIRQIPPQPGNTTALSPRVSQKRLGLTNSSGPPTSQGATFFPALATSLTRSDELFSSGSAADEAPSSYLSATYNDDNIDNSSEKPVDYSQMYQESGSVYEQPISNAGAPVGYAPLDMSRQQLEYPNSQLPTAFLHHEPAMLLQTSSGSFMDPSFFDVPTLEEIKAKALSEKSAVVQQRPRPGPLSDQPASSGSRAMPRLSRIEDQHDEDQVQTFCTEGTPMNYLSTATSMNELSKIGEETILERDEQSVSSQATTSHSEATTQESVKPATSERREVKRSTPPVAAVTAKQLEEEDDSPKLYATEDTPLTGISRVSSLSSLSSALDGKAAEVTAAPLTLPTQGGLENIAEDEVLDSATYSKAPPKTPLEQKTVSFDDHAHVQETPMMFSRASSLASLSSCDQQSIHSSVFSDYSRRASQVVSPSDLPDSPGGTTPHSPSSKRKVKDTRAEKRKEATTPPLPQAQQLNVGGDQSESKSAASEPADSQSQAVTNLLGLSGMFGSLSGLASLQGPDVDDGDANHYAQRLLNRYCQPPATNQQPLYHGVLPQYYKQQPHAAKVIQVPPMRSFHGELSSQFTSLSNPQQSAPVTDRPPSVSQCAPAADAGISSAAASQADAGLKKPGILRSSTSAPTSVESAPPANYSSRVAFTNSKVDQFLSDTIRTYADEGTPGPNSTRSSLSALTFIDEPEFPLSGLSLLRSVGEEASAGRLQKTSDKPQDSSAKPSSSKNSNEPDEPAPPLPPRPANLTMRKEKAAAAKAASIKPAAPVTSASDVSPPAAAKPQTPGRSRNVSESVHDSDSSSDGDDYMLQKCISSAMPINKSKLPKSSSDGQVTGSGGKPAARSVPRSKTFGSKLRMPKKTLKAAQLAKQRQAPPIVSANSPTPDDDYFAEETVKAYCTEDTPYNKSTATSLSDLSVIDDDVNDMEDEQTATGDSNERVPTGGQSSSDSSDDDDDVLSNAILSAIPKKPGKTPQPQEVRNELKYTSNELRATDVKFQTSADSMRNYATEGTPNNFSTNTSLSDLTIDSHYSTNKSVHSTTRSASASKSGSKGTGGKLHSVPSSPSQQSSLLPKRYGSLGQSSSFTSQGGVVASTPSRPSLRATQSTSTPQGRTINMSDQDEMRSFGVEGTPFNYSRRESLSSLSCDDDDDEEVNITIINRVNEAMMRKMQEGKDAKATTTSSSSSSGSQSSRISGVKNESRVTLPASAHRPGVVVNDGIIRKFTLPPPTDGFQSRDEVTKAYTPIEGTPYCFSRNSPLSSLSSSSSSLEDVKVKPSDNMASIDEAHQAEGGRITDSSESDSDASQGSLASSHAFLDKCISSALPKKASSLPKAKKLSTKVPAGQQGSTSQVSAATRSSQSATKKTPPQPMPKPIHAKPSPVDLLPAGSEMVVSQRSSRAVSTDTSTDSVKSEAISSSNATTSSSLSSVATAYKTTKDHKLRSEDKELRRRTYTISASDIQSAISLIPSVSKSGPATELEGNIEISGDEDEFDDVYLLENGELFKQDVNAILAALEEASNAPELTSDTLPKPPSCFADGETASASGTNVYLDLQGERVEGDVVTHNDDATDIQQQRTLLADCVPQLHKGPRITKPDLSAKPCPADAGKAIRGRRKPLYQSKYATKNAVAKQEVGVKAGVAVCKQQSKMPTLTPGRGGASKPVSSLKRPTTTSTSSAKGQGKQDGVVGKGTKSSTTKMNTKFSTLPTPTAKFSGQPRPRNAQSEMNLKPVASVKGVVGLHASEKQVKNNKGSAAGKSAPSTAGNKKFSRPSSLSSPAVVSKVTAKSNKDGSSKNTPMACKEERSSSVESKGKVVSPCTALHRAAGGSVKTLTSSLPRSRGSTSRLPSTSTGQRPQAVSKPVGTRAERPVNGLRTRPDGSVNQKVMKCQRSTTSPTPANKGLEERPYIASISFRELAAPPADNIASVEVEPSITLNQPSSVTSSKSVDVGAADSVDKSPNPDCAKVAEKNSAIVSPFMYKPQTMTSTGSVGKDTADFDLFSQQNLCGQENKITVHLDIKPCITLSDISHNRARDAAPVLYQFPCSDSKSNVNPPLTKTEMLLRRRSEILGRRQQEQRQPSKSTDV